MKFFDELDENMTSQNLWDIVKAMLRGTFIPLNAYIRQKI